MFKQVNVLDVSVGDERVGRLAQGPDRRCLFEYDPHWLRKGFSVSPFYLPLQSGVFTARNEPFNGMFGVFNDSLPDGWGQLLIDRWVKSKGIDPLELSPLDRLGLVGHHGMGALTYHPPWLSPEDTPLRSMGFYAETVEKILRNDFTGSLEELVDKGGSSGGARPKVLVTIDEKEWLVKFRAAVDPANVGEIEYHHSQLARKCGIDMPETRLFEGKYFGVRRFDREGNRRFHVHSAAGLLYASYRLPSLDYTGLMKATMALTRDIREADKMFRLTVFNVLIGNKDDHAKNFSFIYRDDRWQLSPAYDLLPSGGFNGNHTTTVNGQGKPTLKDCLEVAKLVSFPEKRAMNIIGEVKAGLC